MHLTEEQQQVLSMLKSVYDSIQFHGIYAKYTRSVGILARALKLDDPAELHYVMMHLARLSYLKNSDGAYIWSSRRYAELVNCDELSELDAEANNGFNGVFAEDELAKMETEAFRFRQISTNLIDTHLTGKGQFTCHAKVYPVYGESGSVVLTLAVLTEVTNHHEKFSVLPTQKDIDESVLAF